MDKLLILRELLLSYKKIAVAFSAGVDSTFLLAFAVNTLGAKNVAAYTVRSALNPKEETGEAVKIATELGVLHRIAAIDEFGDPEILNNPPDRCYRCKRQLFTELLKMAKEDGFDVLCDGTNKDDRGKYRPGLLALEELSVKSPLSDAGLTKAEIREAAQQMGLVVYNKPSAPCLATRIPYNSPITRDKLAMIEEGERLLKEAGFLDCRLRHCGDTARIEVERELFCKLCSDAALIEAIRSLGFLYVTMDLEGLCSGSMDRVLGR